MIPTLFQIGPFPLNSFGLMMVLAFFAAWRMFAVTLERVGEDPLMAENVVFWTALSGLLGARVAYILSFPYDFIQNPFALIFSGAGFVFYGGFIGGALAFFWQVKKKKFPLLTYCDLVSPALSLGYAVGRIGCQLSGDGDYGTISSLPWAMGYEHGYIPTPSGLLVHPTPVYETLIALVIAALLLQLSFRGRLILRNGAISGLYLILSSAARFAIEFLRIEPRVFQNFTQAQLVSIVLIAIGGLLLLNSFRLKTNSLSVSEQKVAL